MARQKGKSGFGLFITVVIVLLICGLIGWRISELNKTLESKENELAAINSEIDRASEKTKDIENEIKYRQTDDYIEDVAKDSLGLRYPDEIILVPENTD